MRRPALVSRCSTAVAVRTKSSTSVNACSSSLPPPTSSREPDRSSGGQNGYITALDPRTGKLKWRSAPLTCNTSNFLLDGDAIIAGYGFTEEPDFLYVLDRKTGKPLFPVEERSVPSGGVEPDKLAKTQPYSGYAHLDQPELTVLAPMAYSSVRSQPMIQAINSPSVAYA